MHGDVLRKVYNPGEEPRMGYVREPLRFQARHQEQVLVR